VQTLADSLIVPECVYRPRSFSGLMTLYESNYLKLNELFREGLPGHEHAVSAVPDDCELHVEILARERYTSTLKMTYWFDDDSRPLSDPDMVVRIYHDAALVEGVRGRSEHRHHVLKRLAASHSAELDRRWRVNIMLNKWLDYLLEKGHGFG
jgi:uncharacterized protein YqiB (DUF1249 family)